MASEYEKMIAGDFYRPGDPELRALAKVSREKQEAFNQEVDPKKGASIIKEWFGSTGENLYLNRQVKTSISIVKFLWIMGSTSIWEKISMPITI